MSRRPATMNYPLSSPSAADKAFSLAHLTEYAHTLDSLPIDLSRSYGDLRELDAVLSSSMTLLTSKINELISMIETKSGSNDDRLYLLTEIADEAGRLRLGGEDKIRVACHAADGLLAHKSYMRALLDRIPEKEFGRTAEALSRKTVFPHVSSRHFYPPGMSGEGGRRPRRPAGASAGYGALLTNGGEASPGKRKRAPKDDDVDVTRTPSKKDRVDAPVARPRPNARPRKGDRVTSPAESVVSIASHLPQNMPPQSSAAPARLAANGRVGSGSSNKRTQNNENARRDAFSAQPPAANHPSLPSYGLATQASVVAANNGRAMSNGLIDWPHGQLEGPGMPVARNNPRQQAAGDGNDGAVSAEPDADADDRTYCFCDGVSYGEMIGCDDANCEREWFHLACVGLTVVPAGAWCCSQCLERRQNQKKAASRGKKRTVGGRAGMKNGA